MKTRRTSRLGGKSQLDQSHVNGTIRHESQGIYRPNNGGSNRGGSSRGGGGGSSDGDNDNDNRNDNFEYWKQNRIKTTENNGSQPNKETLKPVIYPLNHSKFMFPQESFQRKIQLAYQGKMSLASSHLSKDTANQIQGNSLASLGSSSFSLEIPPIFITNEDEKKQSHESIKTNAFTDQNPSNHCPQNASQENQVYEKRKKRKRIEFLHDFSDLEKTMQKESTNIDLLEQGNEKNKLNRQVRRRNELNHILENTDGGNENSRRKQQSGKKKKYQFVENTKYDFIFKTPSKNLLEGLNEIHLSNIFSHLDAIPYYFSLQMVCKSWQRFLSNVEIWKNVKQLNFSSIDMEACSEEDISRILQKVKGSLKSLIFSDIFIPEGWIENIAEKLSPCLEKLTFAFFQCENSKSFFCELSKLYQLKYLCIAGDESNSDTQYENIKNLIQAKNFNNLKLEIEWSAMSLEQFNELQDMIKELNKNNHIYIELLSIFPMHDKPEILNDPLILLKLEEQKKELQLTIAEGGNPTKTANGKISEEALDIEQQIEAKKKELIESRKEYGMKVITLLKHLNISPNTTTFAEMVEDELDFDYDIMKEAIKLGFNTNKKYGKEKVVLLHLQMKCAQSIVLDWKKLRKELKGFRHKNPQDILRLKKIEWNEKSCELKERISFLLAHGADPTLRNASRKSSIDMAKNLEKELSTEIAIDTFVENNKKSMAHQIFLPFEANDFLSRLFFMEGSSAMS